MVDGVCWHVSAETGRGSSAHSPATYIDSHSSNGTRRGGAHTCSIGSCQEGVVCARGFWDRGYSENLHTGSAVCERALLDPPRFHNHRAIRVKKHLPAHTSSSAPRFEILLLKVCVGKSAGGRMHCEYTELVLNTKSGENSSENTTRRTPYH